MNESQGLNVVLGTGALGLAVARHLSAREARIRVVSRSADAASRGDAEFIAADVAEPTEAKRACAGAAVVYHCASPPYHLWPKLHPPLMAAIIEGAAGAGAKLVFGDNLYAYGPLSGAITEDLPYRADGPNGRTRAHIARMLLSAHDQGRVRAAIGRGSDFFGPSARQSTVGEVVFARALAGKPAQLLGNPDLPHSVTYIDDFGRALVALGERDEALGGVWHVPNAPVLSLRRFVEMVFMEIGRSARIQVAPRIALKMIALFNPTLRAVTEQLYQVDRPWIVDSSKFERTFGWKATPLQDAVRTTVAWFRDNTAH
ncbi:MAG: NAD-dependent epimerase/dehydratase family protein [Chloroflexota bacterium]|nr:NAD-dependent epimerase/dehydratase family protein [Chloroflexota bacterium]